MGRTRPGPVGPACVRLVVPNTPEQCRLPCLPACLGMGLGLDSSLSTP